MVIDLLKELVAVPSVSADTLTSDEITAPPPCVDAITVPSTLPEPANAPAATSA